MLYNFFMPTPDQGVIQMLREHGHGVLFANDDWKTADIAIFTGGEDVHPIFYGQDIIASTISNLRRDKREVSIYRNLPIAMPKVGICRGAQFLNIMSGGSMWQHVDNHTRSHEVFACDYDDESFEVSSTHHQMMRPGPEGWVMWAAQECHRVEDDKEILDVTKDADFMEAELVYYHHTNSLCCQPHPEYPGFKKLTEAFFEHVNNMFENDVKKAREKKAVK